MSIEFKLPELGENVDSGDIVNILVDEGQTIAANDGVLEVETDKAVVELPCPHGGRVAKVHVKKGDSVKVGQTLLTIEPDEEGADEEEAEEPQAEPAEEPETKEEPKKADQEEAAKPPKKETPKPEKPRRAADEPLPAGPAARRIARELGVDLAQIEGSGQRGRITTDDVRAAAEGGATTGAMPTMAAPAAVEPPGEPGTDKWGSVRRERMPKVRRTIAAQMVKSAGTIPHVTNFDEADVTDLESLRKSVPADYLGENVRLTAMPFVLRAVALSLRQHPAVNASIDDENEQVIYKEYVNLGVAVDTPRGLVVPALRGVDRLGIAQIAQQLGTIAQKARSADFAVEDLRGGTFTISNLGAIGGIYSTPIINHPEVAILLLGRTRWLPVVRDGQIVPRQMMPLSLSYDHRLVDGATAGRFLNDVIALLQSPMKLLL